jgi:hypothetical protein
MTKILNLVFHRNPVVINVGVYRTLYKQDAYHNVYYVIDARTNASCSLTWKAKAVTENRVRAAIRKTAT